MELDPSMLGVGGACVTDCHATPEAFAIPFASRMNVASAADLNLFAFALER